MQLRFWTRVSALEARSTQRLGLPAACCIATLLACAPASVFFGSRMTLLLVVPEMLLLSFVLRRSRFRGVAPAALALGLGQLAYLLLERFPSLDDQLRTAASGAWMLRDRISPQIVRAFVWQVASALDWPGVVAVSLLVLFVFLLRARDSRAAAPLYALALSVGLAFLDPAPALAAHVCRLDIEVPLRKPAYGAFLLPVKLPLALPPAPPSAPPVWVINLESIGTMNLEEHIRSHPGCAFARWHDEALAFDSVLMAGNVTHLSTAAMIASQQIATDGDNVTVLPRPPKLSLTMAEYFRARNYSTSLVSSQDERWFRMDRYTTKRGFDRTDDGVGEGPDYYQDACGLPDRWDSATIAHANALVDGAKADGRPRFTWVKLHDTHYPYEFGTKSPPELDCRSVFDMQPEKVPLARVQYEAALRHTEELLVPLVARARASGAVVLLTTDHGEEFVPGTEFGHGKQLSRVQSAGFAWFFGPGIAPRVVTAPVSSVDVFPTLVDLIFPEDLPKVAGAMEGSTLLDAKPRPVVTASAGFDGELAVVAGDVKLRWKPGQYEMCTDRRDTMKLSALDPRCATAFTLLRDWSACRREFSKDPASASYASPCNRLIAAAGR